ncbi:MAG: TolC family protein [Treponema sp.]|jgi:outer membrane protein TolC|nr:TolC family protein [Treponema sp.]
MKKGADFRIFLSMLLFIPTVAFPDIPKDAALERAALEGAALTLEDVRLLALANSRSLARYNLAIESGLLDEKAQNFTYLPSLSLTGAASMKLWDSGGGALSSAALDSLSAGAALEISETLPLYEGGKAKILKAIYALSTESTRKDALAEYYTILNNTDSAYYEALKAQANLESAESALAAAELSLAASQIRYEHEMIRYGDYLQALSERESAVTAKKQAERSLAITMANLKNIAGIAETPVLAPVDFSRHESLILYCTNLDENDINALCSNLWGIMMANNPQLAKEGISMQKAEKNSELAAKDYLPSVSAGLSTGLDYTYQYGKSNAISPFTGSLSIRVSIPLDFWVIKNKVDKQKLSQEQTRLGYLDTVSSIYIEMQSAILDLSLQAGTVVSSRRAYEYAQKHFEYIQELYQLYQKSLSEYYDAANQAHSSLNRCIEAQYGFLLALSKIRSLGAFGSDEAVVAFLLDGRSDDG